MGRMRASGFHCPSEERSVVGGTHGKIRAWCPIQFGVESGPCALLCTVAKRSMDASSASGIAAVFAAPGKVR